MSDSTSDNDRAISEYASTIVSAFVSKNAIPMSELPSLIAATHAALIKVTSDSTVEAVDEPLEPRVSVKKSITPDYLICLEDGLKFKSLRRHLKTAFNMTPDDYRAKWGLPPHYPMVAPNYAETRSKLARSYGLGLKASSKPSPAADSTEQKTSDDKRIEADFLKENDASPKKAATRKVDAPKATKTSGKNTTAKKKAAA